MRSRILEKGLLAKGITEKEKRQYKALKKELGFKNNSEFVQYLLDKHANNYKPFNNEKL